MSKKQNKADARESDVICPNDGCYEQARSGSLCVAWVSNRPHQGRPDRRVRLLFGTASPQYVWCPKCGPVKVAIPAPPSGPEAEPYAEEEGRPPAFDRFMESDDGRAFWRAIRAAALGALHRGEKRFSPRGFLAHYRDTRKVRVNNIFSPWFADMLIMEQPELESIVERRKRKKQGPFDVAMK